MRTTKLISVVLLAAATVQAQERPLADCFNDSDLEMSAVDRPDSLRITDADVTAVLARIAAHERRSAMRVQNDLEPPPVRRTRDSN